MVDPLTTRACLLSGGATVGGDGVLSSTEGEVSSLVSCNTNSSETSPAFQAQACTEAGGSCVATTDGAFPSTSTSTSTPGWQLQVLVLHTAGAVPESSKWLRVHATDESASPDSVQHTHTYAQLAMISISILVLVCSETNGRRRRLLLLLLGAARSGYYTLTVVCFLFGLAWLRYFQSEMAALEELPVGGDDSAWRVRAVASASAGPGANSGTENTKKS
jgi:hypothetical protein